MFVRVCGIISEDQRIFSEHRPCNVRDIKRIGRGRAEYVYIHKCICERDIKERGRGRAEYVYIHKRIWYDVGGQRIFPDHRWSALECVGPKGRKRG